MRSRSSEIKELSEALSVLERCYLSQKETAETLNKLADNINKIFIKNNAVIKSNVTELTEVASKLKCFMEVFTPIVNELSQNSQDIINLSKEIEEVKENLTKIEKIASDTELIAINAAIEAARAGEQGRSSAVVANKIKDMSKDIFKTLWEIQKLSNDIDKRLSVLKRTVENVEELKKTSDELVSGMKKLINISTTLQNIYSAQEKVSRDVKGLSGISKSINKIFELLSETKKKVAEGLSSYLSN